MSIRTFLIIAVAVASMAARASATDSETVLYAFGGIPNDGAGPAAGLIVDLNGDLFGTTQAGGAPGCSRCYGTVYELTFDGTSWHESILHSFSGADGYYPLAPVIFDGQGDLFGTTSLGGTSFGSGCNTNGCGEVFELTLGAGGWTENALFDFAGGSDGLQPDGAVALDKAGDLYGTTFMGGDLSCGGGDGCGLVFELKPALTGPWHETVLRSFAGTPDGAMPTSRLLVAASGSVFGTTGVGGMTGGACGTLGCGIAFELAKRNGTWTETILHTFTAGSDGASPSGGLIMDAKGALYGAASGGGAHGLGVVYRLTHSPSGWKERVLHSFSSTASGIAPYGDLAFDSHGDLFGAAGGGGDCTIVRTHLRCGVVYELAPGAGGAWVATLLYSFQKTVGGWQPNGDLLIDASENVLGTTYRGTTSNGCCGLVFKLVP